MKVQQLANVAPDLDPYQSDDEASPVAAEDVEGSLSEISLESDEDQSDDWVLSDEKDKSVQSSYKSTVPSPKKQFVRDEYEYDSSDEEDIRNTVGNVPLQWYRDYDHIGYDWSGSQILKPKSASGSVFGHDLIDTFISRMNDPNTFSRTVIDPQTGQEVSLSKEDIEVIRNIQQGKYPDLGQDPYEPWVDLYSHEVEQFPAIDAPPSKRSFTPSIAERVKIGRMVHSIKMGWMKPRGAKPLFSTNRRGKYYLMWRDGEEPEVNKYHRTRIPAPKLSLPETAESYNPPAEYLLTPEEKEKWEKTDPEDRRQNYVPQKYGSLRHVPAFSKFIQERFQRCLDLYLCPRATKTKAPVDNPEDLLPKLPRPRDLEPFPKLLSITYSGHTSLVRSITLDYSGQWLVSGSDDSTVRFWEVLTGRLMWSISLSTDQPVKNVVCNPNPQLTLVAAVVGNEIVLINSRLGDKVLVESTSSLFSEITPSKPITFEEGNINVKWSVPKASKASNGAILLRLEHPKEISKVSWHSKGDYFVATMPQGQSQSVYVHQMSKFRSQNPFRKAKGLVGSAIFHPTRPQLFVVSQQSIRIYDLLKQQLLRKLTANCKWISSAEIHPASGDHVLVGSYDCRLNWFDLNLSPRPYRTIRPHQSAVRQVAFHKRYPLFASCSDDGSILVSHATVEDDLLTNATIVPLRVLRNGHSVDSTETNNLGILDIVFHPTQPWLFSCGADGKICLWTALEILNLICLCSLSNLDIIQLRKVGSAKKVLEHEEKRYYVVRSTSEKELRVYNAEVVTETSILDSDRPEWRNVYESFDVQDGVNDDTVRVVGTPIEGVVQLYGREHPKLDGVIEVAGKRKKLLVWNKHGVELVLRCLRRNMRSFRCIGHLKNDELIK